jgi:hypothetical protein
VDVPLTDAVTRADRALRDGAAGKTILPDVIAALMELSSRLGAAGARGHGGFDVDWQEKVLRLVRSLRAAARDGGLAEMMRHGRRELRPLVATTSDEYEGEPCEAFG